MRPKSFGAFEKRAPEQKTKDNLELTVLYKQQFWMEF